MSLGSVLLGDGTFSLAGAKIASYQPEPEAPCGGDPQAGQEQIVLAILTLFLSLCCVAQPPATGRRQPGPPRSPPLLS